MTVPPPRRRFFAAMGFWLLAALAPAAANACGFESPCEVDAGFYLRRLPAGWDGRSPLPVVVFYHGYGAATSVYGSGLTANIKILLSGDNTLIGTAYNVLADGSRADFKPAAHAAGTYNVYIQNADGQRSSATFAFTYKP